MMAQCDVVSGLIHKICSECQHRTVTLVPGWVTGRFLSDKSLAHIHACSKPQPFLSIQQLMGIVAGFKIDKKKYLYDIGAFSDGMFAIRLTTLENVNNKIIDYCYCYFFEIFASVCIIQFCIDCQYHIASLYNL